MVLTVGSGHLSRTGGQLLSETQRIPERENSSGVLRLFVYGTLKRGYWNHDPFCRGVLAIQEAQVRGRLFEGPGFPVLEVPDEDILAHGTGDPLTDVGTQARLSEQWCPRPVSESTTVGASGAVYGELLTFDDPLSRLPAIDRLEGFRPGSSSLYRRVLVPATVHGVRKLAWVYTVEATRIKQRRIVSGHWPK